MHDKVENQKNKRKTIVLWVIIVLLLGLLAWKFSKEPEPQPTVTPNLGNPGTEYFNQEPQKQEQQKFGKIGVSIPASFAVQDGKALITIKNTGQQAFIPYLLAEGRESYRASRVIKPGEKVSAVIPVGTADKCVTYVETLNGEKFSVTSKLVQ